jgi:hypothetical protein
MARLDALSIKMTDGSTAEKLAEEYGKVIENLQHITLASRLKNTDLSGDPTSGTVEAKRFVNVSSAAYGTARGHGYADKIKAQPVVVALNDNTEYLEEIEEKDLKTYGISGLIERRTRNHQDALAVELDTKFFAEAVTAGTAFTATGTPSIEDEIEEAIQKIETTKNGFVQGVPRNMIEVVMSPKYYGKLRNKINAISNSNNLGVVPNYEQGTFNNVNVYSNVFLPNGINYVVMVKGAVAQPIMTSIYNPKQIELSDAIGFGLFAYKGTKAVMSDLIIYNGSVVSL